LYRDLRSCAHRSSVGFAIVAVIDGVVVRVYSAGALGFAPPANEPHPPAA
jgi:hypothetical protein